MKTAYELASVALFELLARKALGQIGTAKNSEERADAEGHGISEEKAAGHSDDTDDEEDPGEERVHELFPSGLGGSGRLQTRPNRLERVRQELLAHDLSLGGLLQSESQLGRRLAESVCDVSQVPAARLAFVSKCFALGNREIKEVGFEVHGTECTPQGVIGPALFGVGVLFYFAP